MSSIITLNQLRKEGHASCVACIHPELKLDFSLTGPKQLHSSVDFKPSMCSFNGHVHGGVLAFVIDEAVTCLLMSEGKYGVTGELKLRYKRPVSAGPTSHVDVRLERNCGRLTKIVATINQGGKNCVRAEASMMEEALDP
ncbi:MAG TPA: PaaI family thioesterase [Opitutales bacterium]|nr:PaaI family thioesterase [Opitutales bacterium]